MKVNELAEIVNSISPNAEISFIINGEEMNFEDFKYTKIWDNTKCVVKTLQVRFGGGEPVYISPDDLATILQDYITQQQLADAIGNVNLSNYYTKAQVDFSQEEQDNAIADKADKGDVSYLSSTVSALSSNVFILNEDVGNIKNDLYSEADEANLYLATESFTNAETSEVGIRLRWFRPNASNDALMTRGQFEFDGTKCNYKGTFKFAGVIEEESTINDIVDVYCTSTGISKVDGDKFIEFYDYEIEKSPQIYNYIADSNTWSKVYNDGNSNTTGNNLVEYLDLRLGDFIRILHFCNNFDATGNSVLTNGRLQFANNYDNGNYFLFQEINEKISSGSGGGGYEPDWDTIELNEDNQLIVGEGFKENYKSEVINFIMEDSAGYIVHKGLQDTYLIGLSAGEDQLNLKIKNYNGLKLPWVLGGELSIDYGTLRNKLGLNSFEVDNDADEDDGITEDIKDYIDNKSFAPYEASDEEDALEYSDENPDVLVFIGESE
jgi:hypothetical protein